MYVSSGNFYLQNDNGTLWHTSVFIDYSNDYITAGGFKKSGSSSAYVLTGDGGHKAISDFANATNSTNVYIEGASGNVNYPLLFTTATANGNSRIYADSQWRTAGITFNPSTNILRVPYVNDIKFKYAVVDSSVYTTSFRAHIFGESTSTKSKLSVVRFNSPCPNEGYGYGTGIAFQGSDTQGMMIIKYDSPGVCFSGGSTANQAWWMKITGANHASYDLSNFVTKTAVDSSFGLYLPLAGGDMTGTIHRTTTSTNNTPVISLHSPNLDSWIWRVRSSNMII